MLTSMLLDRSVVPNIEIRFLKMCWSIGPFIALPPTITDNYNTMGYLDGLYVIFFIHMTT